MKSARVPTGNSPFTLRAASCSSLIAEWYREHRRDLPWRTSRDPYRIWISEVMLQQTTVAAVIPYYERFLKDFPTVKILAKAPLQQVLDRWSGLGYYSRARNLHKAAEKFATEGFPKTTRELLEFPGLGPYTARAIAALAFGERVGVLDGNVIRLLSRLTGAPIEHWKPAGRQQLQTWADQLAQFEDPSDLNQGMMEIGATICTPQKPACLLCPLRNECVARRESRVTELPLKKPRRESEIWVWQPEIMIQKNRVALVQNPELPFLRGQLVFPGTIKQVKERPERFDLRHGITHHDIYIRVKVQNEPDQREEPLKWVSIDKMASVNPSILLKKVIDKVLSSSR